MTGAPEQRQPGIAAQKQQPATTLHACVAMTHAASIMQGLLPLFPELLLQLPSGAFTCTSLLLLAYLGPTMWYLWMVLGTGNANFFYAITLLWGAWQVMPHLQ